MILNEREVKILEKFYNNRTVYIADLSKEFSVSERMIRYNIDEINTLLEFIKTKPIRKIGKGKYILENSSTKLLDMIKELEPINKYKRQSLIQMYLLFSGEKINIKSLAEKFQLTRITINADIKEINRILDVRGLKIANNKGLVIIGENDNIKKYKIFILSEQLELLLKNDSNEYSNKVKEIIFRSISENNFKKIKIFIDNIINENKIKLDDLNYKYFYSQIVNIFCDDDENNDNELNLSDRKYVIENLKKLKLYKELSIHKIDEISNLVAWIKSYENYEDFYQDWLNVEVLVKNIIKTVENKISIQISKDKLLEEFLIQHLKALIYRTQKGYKLKKEEIIGEKEEDELYLIIKNSLELITQLLGNKIENDEIHLLKIHFLASIERINKLKSEPIEVVIITSLGPGSNKILIDNIKSKFLINVVYIGPLYKMSSVLKEHKNIKYILTTTGINENEYKGKKIIKINTILSLEDKQKLASLGFRTNNNKINLSNLIEVISQNCRIDDRNALIENLMTNFNDRIINDVSEFIGNEDVLLPKNIIFDYEAADITDAIEKCCKNLEGEYTDATYTKEVLDIFANNHQHIIRYNGVILPHTRNKGNVYKNGVSILKLKNPVIINDTKEKIDTVVSFVIKDEKNISNKISNVINKVFRVQFKKMMKEKNKISIINYLMS